MDTTQHPRAVFRPRAALYPDPAHPMGYAGAFDPGLQFTWAGLLTPVMGAELAASASPSAATYEQLVQQYRALVERLNCRWHRLALIAELVESRPGLLINTARRVVLQHWFVPSGGATLLHVIEQAAARLAALPKPLHHVPTLENLLWGWVIVVAARCESQAPAVAS